MSQSRKQFIESHGATCKNWNWSWSFVNHEKKMVIFGAWDVESEKERAIILKEEWKTSAKGKRPPGYSQAIEHIKLVSEGYILFTFNMIFSEKINDPGVASIKDFERSLQRRFLSKEDGNWYADFSENPYPDDIISPDSYIEGAKKTVTVNSFERDAKARRACIDYHGLSCKCCGFNFGHVYGEHGEGFIHVHHVKPLHSIGEEYEVDPVQDLIPLCPNCHSMIHRRNSLLSVDELIKKIRR